ncbi:hypothetical protein H0H92_003470 [Tricholoma furcatifolium]|nr:hypothetical protein H0H92_003470 [Tricholoma furcatifolium]
MAFTGYVFDSAEAISPYLEEPKTGPSSLFYQEIAKHLGCFVFGGYPERLSDEEKRIAPLSEPQTRRVADGALPAEGMVIPPSNDGGSPVASHLTTTPPHIQVGANSAIIYGPSGEWVGGYRKTNMFETDMTWAKPGTGFASFSLTLPSMTTSSQSTPSTDIETPSPLKISLGICMDLNPHPPSDWESAFGPYELADYCVQNETKLLVLLNAWLSSGLDENGEEIEGAGNSGAAGQGSGTGDGDDAESQESDWCTLQYWTARLTPLWKRDRRRRRSDETIMSGSSSGSVGSADSEPKGGEMVAEEEDKPPHETIVAVCNRVGKENGKTFAGSSAIFSMRAGSGRPKVLDAMGRNEEGVRVWNLLV